MSQNTTKTTASPAERGEPEQTERTEYPSPFPELLSELRQAAAQLTSAAEQLVSSGADFEPVKASVEAQRISLHAISELLANRLPNQFQAVAGNVKVLKATAPLRHEAVLAAVAHVEQSVSQAAELSAERHKGLAEASRQNAEETRREARANYEAQKQLFDGVLRAVQADIPSGLKQLNQAVTEAARATADQSRTELHILETVQTLLAKDLPEKIATAHATLLNQMQDVVDSKVAASGRRTRVELARLKALVSQADQNLKRAESGLAGLSVKPGAETETGNEAASETRIAHIPSHLDGDAHTKFAQAKKEVEEANELLSHLSILIPGAGKLDLSARERVALIFMATALIGFLVWVYGQVKISVVAADRERTTAEAKRVAEDVKQCGEREKAAAAKLIELEQQRVKLESILESKVKESNDLSAKVRMLQEQKACRPVRTAAVAVPLLLPLSSPVQFPCAYGLDCRTVAGSAPGVSMKAGNP